MCAAIVESRKEDIESALANFDGLRNFDNRDEEIWTVPFIMCGVFCPHRLAELERAAWDILGGKRAEPKKIKVEEANRAAANKKDGKRAAKDLLPYCDEKGMRTATALLRLVEINDGPWRNYAGVGITAMKLAELLATVGVHSKQYKVKGENRNGYLRVDLQAVVDRFGLADDPKGGKAGGGA